MSPTGSNMSGGKGKKRPGKPGRFDPSEPLHMTTRRAARSKSNGGTPSVNGSVDGDYSRRGSIDDSRPSTSQGESSEYSYKSRRTSNGSVAVVSPAVTPNGLPYSTAANNADALSLALTTSQQSPSPSRKRKRSSSSMRPPIRSNTPSAAADVPVQSLETTVDTQIPDAPISDITEEATAEGDAVEQIPNQNLSEPEEVSQNSSQSEEQRLQLENYNYPSAEITPAESNAPSPQFVNSESDEQQTPPEANDMALENEAGEDQDEIAEPAELDVDTEVVEEADEPNGQAPSGSSGEQRPRRRFGGRRRAQHPIPRIEKAMQRQAELKAHYRTLTRALKPVLAEIAKRTTDELEADPEAHTKAAEWPGVKQQLDERLAQRKEQIMMQHKYCLEQLEKDKEQYAEQIKMTCRNEIEDLKDLFLARMEMEMVRIARAAHLESAEREHATDDEDGVIPRPKRAGYGFKVASKPLEEEYLSRTRIYTEPARALEEWEARRKMRQLLDTLPDDQRPTLAHKRKFAVMDDGPRNAALARKEASTNFDILAQAATDVERATKKQKVIRNEDCQGLQLLGDLASRPSLTATTKPAKGSQSRRASSRPVPPPQLQIQTGYQHSLIPVEMSPRTTQALGDRFDGTMLPPTTPGRAPGPPTFIRSPEATRPESTLPSPTMNINRFNNPQPPMMGTPDIRPESQRGQFMELARPGSEMRPPSGHRQEPQFSPPQQQNERRMDFPLWREYPRDSPGGLHRRSSSHNERPPIGTGMPQPMRDDRQNPVLPRMQEAPKAPELQKEMSSPFSQMQGRPPMWQDRPSQPGASDIRFQDPRSPQNVPQRPTFDQQSPHSRNSSMTFVKDFRNSGIVPKEDPNRPRSKGPMNTTFKTKTNKEERDGLSRRSWTNQRKMSKTLGGPGLAASPPLAAAAPSPREVPPPPAPWATPSQHHQPHHSPPVPPPPVPYQQSPYSQPPPVPGFRPAQQTPEQFPNRNNFPPRPSSSTFDRLPPTPLYGMAQQQQPQPPQQQEHGHQHPPPPGVPPEQYNRPYAAPPPPGYQAQPPPPLSGPPHQSPQMSLPPPAPGSSYMSQFGGPPLAPAGGNAYHAPGFRPAPAFAQQAQQQQQQAQQSGGPGGHRRRTQSDASQFAKFHSWNPPSKRT